MTDRISLHKLTDRRTSRARCGKLAKREQRVYIYLQALLKPPQVTQSPSSANPP